MKKGLLHFTGAVILLMVIGCFFVGCVEKQAREEQKKIENQVALDAEKQYEIAKKNGKAMDAYIQAGMVAAAYLQANDEANYKKWKDIETKEAKNAGMPAN